jgi:hypothetical protein
MIFHRIFLSHEKGINRRYHKAKRNQIKADT